MRYFSLDSCRSPTAIRQPLGVVTECAAEPGNAARDAATFHANHAKENSDE